MSATLAGASMSTRTGMKAVGGQGPSGSAAWRVSLADTGSTLSPMTPSSAAQVSAEWVSVAAQGFPAGQAPALAGPAFQVDPASLAGQAGRVGPASSARGVVAGGASDGPSAATSGRPHWPCSPRSR